MYIYIYIFVFMTYLYGAFVIDMIWLEISTYEILAAIYVTKNRNSHQLMWYISLDKVLSIQVVQDFFINSSTGPQKYQDKDNTLVVFVGLGGDDPKMHVKDLKGISYLCICSIWQETLRYRKAIEMLLNACRGFHTIWCRSQGHLITCLLFTAVCCEHLEFLGADVPDVVSNLQLGIRFLSRFVSSIPGINWRNLLEIPSRSLTARPWKVTKTQ